MIKYICPTCNIETVRSVCPSCNRRADFVESKLFWCNHCNIPIYDEFCPVCGEKGKYFTSDVRPVFPEERLLLEIMLGEPLKYINDSVWNGAGNRYFVNGKKVDLRLGNFSQFDIEDIKQKIHTYQSKNNYDHFNEVIGSFLKANAQRYDFITTEACRWICDESKKYDESSMFVSFSGGKDSTVVSSLVTRALGKSGIIHIFGNTTLEFPSTISYVKRFRENNRSTPLLIAENRQQDFFELCESFGPPSRMLRWCCTIFKTGFIGERILRTFKDKTAVLTFYGIRRFESASRSKYERKDDSPKISKQKVTSPIIDWTDFDVWLYILSSKIDFNDAYRLGFTRVGCWCCPNNSKWSEFLTKIYMPDLSEKLNNMLLTFAIKMGKENPEEYVTSGGWKARQGGAGVELSKNVNVAFKPCATDENSFNYDLNKPIDDTLYELFKPFGILNFDMGNIRLGEVFVLDSKTKMPILKLKGKKGANELRISVLKKPIAGKTKLIEIEQKIECQITKFQLCTGCHACENACKLNAIKLVKNSEADRDYNYLIDTNKCVHCFECINHYPGGCYMRRVLLPRGKNYGK